MKNLKVVRDYANQQLNNVLSATAYYFDKEVENIEFWQFDRDLALFLNMWRVLKKEEGMLNLKGRHFICLKIIQMFGESKNGLRPPLDSPSSSWLVKDFPESSAELDPKLENIIDAEKLDFLVMALDEAIGDYMGYSSGHATGRKYLFTLHEPNNPNHVYITMSGRLLEDGVSFEHRHIITSTRALIEPLIDDSVKGIPPRLSLVLHGFAVEVIMDLHRDRQILQISPLLPMKRILEKSGYIKNEEEKRLTYTISGKELERLRDEWQIKDY